MAYTVRTQPHDYQFTVEDGQTILDAALKQSILLPYGCRSGNCGVCKSQLVDGKVFYETPPGVEMGVNEVLLCKAQAASDLVVKAEVNADSKEIEIKQMPCRIEKKQMLCHDVMQLFLKVPDNEKLVFYAGQFIDFMLEGGKRRSYSLASAPDNNNLIELHFRYVEGGRFSNYIFNEAKEKDILRIEGPFGRFALNKDSESPIIFVAGGTGFAPIKSVIEDMLANQILRPIYLYWGVRAKEDLYMDDLAKRWAEQYQHIQYIPVLSAVKPEDNWQGRVGFVHEAVGEDFADLSGYEIYAAGPPIMIDAARQPFSDKNLPEDHFFCDAFEYNTVISS